MELDNAKQSALQNLLIKIASTYINIDLSEVHEALSHSLKEMAEFVGADRAYIFDYDLQKNITTNTYEWCAPGIPSEKDNLQNVSIERIRALADKHFLGEVFQVNNVSDLSGGAGLELRSILESQEVKSLISVPMIEKDELIGFVGFESVKNQHTYSDAERAILTVFANMLVNIRRRMQKESKLHSLLQISKDQNKRLKSFAHILTHNVRAHSSNISMILDLMHNEYPELAEFQLIKLLSDTSENLNETISHLNEIVQINTLSKENLTVLNLNEVLESAINNISAYADRNDVNIINLMMDPYEVYGVKHYLESVIQSLLSNAIRYRSPDRNSFIKIYCIIQNKYIVLCIEDNGLGIDLNKHQDDLFGMYKTFHDHSDSKGIGLFISKNQVEAMGGKIDVESVVDKGTTFKIYLTYEEN